MLDHLLKDPAANVLTASASRLAERIAARELTARTVVAAHIARLREANPAINAVIADRYDAALAEAAAIDDRLVQGEAVGPLAGVPFTVKEMISVEGMPHTFGTLRRADRRAAQDATVVARLRQAGAIPIGVTNVPEWGFWFETSNLLFGRTNNPSDVRRTAGGSSGGEAAAIAAGGSPFGIGSDIGGSIRMPAAFCGIFGHKPTSGLVPLTGHYPVYASGEDAALPRASPFLVIGPLARCAEDLMPLLRIMSGPDGVDPNARSIELRDPALVRWSGRRLVVMDDPRILLAARSDSETRAAVKQAADTLAAHGAAVRTAPARLFRDTVDLWTAALHSTGGRTVGEAAGLARMRDFAAAFGASLVGRPRYSLPLLLFGLGERIGAWRTRDLDRFLRRIDVVRGELLDLLGDDGVLLLPAHPRAAPRHAHPLFRPFDYAYTAVFNTLRVPATTAPVAIGRGGLPLGVQIVAPPARDDLGIAAALSLSRERAV